MKHTAAALALLAGLAALTGCAGRTDPGDIRLSQRSATADDWSRHLPALYPGLAACLAAPAAQPAYALTVVPQNHGMLLVYVVGGDGSRMACSVDTAAAQKPALMPATPLADQELHGPRFTPASLPEPFLRCADNEPVLTSRGRLLGWLTYRRPDCSDAALPRQQWRAFGSRPDWTVTIAPDGILFDRPGELPLHYAAQAGATDGDRLTWRLDAPGGPARDGLVLTLTRDACRDADVDRTYDYRATAVFRDRTYAGCAMPVAE